MVKQRQGRSPEYQRGFTLIEVLVVVAIIALLISILLPSLKNAREQARQAVCSANIGQITRGENLYQNQNKEWFPSPLTTGYWWAVNDADDWDPVSNPTQNRLVIESRDWATPILAILQGPKSIPRPTSPVTADDTRKSIVRMIHEGIFRCPSNDLLVPPYGGRPGYPYVRISYLAMWSITRGGPDLYNNPSPYTSGAHKGWIASAPGWGGMAVPNNYMPRHSRLGRESMKVFVADGYMFYGPPSTLDYNTAAWSSKGMMTGEPPSTYSDTPDYCREYTTGHQYSYRHGNNNRIVAGFFDGHAEAMSANVVGTPPPEVPPHMAGKAVDPRYYYPSGSRVVDNTQLHKSTVQNDTTLP